MQGYSVEARRWRRDCGWRCFDSIRLPSVHAVVPVDASFVRIPEWRIGAGARGRKHSCSRRYGSFQADGVRQSRRVREILVRVATRQGSTKDALVESRSQGEGRLLRKHGSFRGHCKAKPHENYRSALAAAATRRLSSASSASTNTSGTRRDHASHVPSGMGRRCTWSRASPKASLRRRS